MGSLDVARMMLPDSLLLISPPLTPSSLLPPLPHVPQKSNHQHAVHHPIQGHTQGNRSKRIEKENVIPSQVWTLGGS